MGKPVTIRDTGLRAVSNYAWLEKTCRGKPPPDGQFTEQELMMVEAWITQMEAILHHLRLADAGQPDALPQLLRYVEDECVTARRHQRHPA